MERVTSSDRDAPAWLVTMLVIVHVALAAVIYLVLWPAARSEPGAVPAIFRILGISAVLCSGVGLSVSKRRFLLGLVTAWCLALGAFLALFFDLMLDYWVLVEVAV
ncbi:hypothetical protein [Piscinibacter gummiphilus]|uniref:Uncharacterized protein n=1 Tax=Piscinibacter gummiphilus TaxID=946333 RepID=A0ABZ0D1Z2_9BURK|nr:hypothetical protein [Piscinibacter gummiphilus]WOB11259.1 hypothetical protein RXV79_26880 [Piscinibacter gummiphilus]